MEKLKVCFLVCNNLYSSKFHFTSKLAVALEKIGVVVKCHKWSHGPVPDNILKEIQKEKPNLTLSFNQVGALSDGLYFFDHLKIPHLTMLLDPAIYDIGYIDSLYSLVSCVDHNDCDFFKSSGFEKVFFFPHAIESSTAVDLKNQRPLDVVFIGTCYDPDGLYDWWSKNYPKEITDIIERAIHIGLGDNSTSIYEAVKQSLTYHLVSPREVDVLKIFYFVDFYMRGIERVNLIRSIKDAKVHVFGDVPAWRDEPVLKNWQDYFAGQKNVTVKESVNYSQSLDILKQSKICLNSSPMFKNGSHERIFGSLSCGAFLITSDNLYVRDQFIEGQDLELFQLSEVEKVNDKVNHILSDEEYRLKAVNSGRIKVMQKHTWEVRAKLLVDSIHKFIKQTT